MHMVVIGVAHMSTATRIWLHTPGSTLQSSIVPVTVVEEHETRLDPMSVADRQKALYIGQEDISFLILFDDCCP